MSSTLILIQPKFQSWPQKPNDVLLVSGGLPSRVLLFSHILVSYLPSSFPVRAFIPACSLPGLLCPVIFTYSHLLIVLILMNLHYFKIEFDIILKYNTYFLMHLL